MTQNVALEYPRTASILALVGGLLMVLSGVILLGASAFILPNINYSNVTAPHGLSPSSIPGLVSGIVGGMGLFGLVCGAIVLVSAVMLMTGNRQPRTWGVLILVFSVVSFLGLGGFVIGAILGIIGGALALRWNAPAQASAQA